MRQEDLPSGLRRDVNSTTNTMRLLTKACSFDRQTAAQGHSPNQQKAIKRVFRLEAGMASLTQAVAGWRILH